MLTIYRRSKAIKVKEGDREKWVESPDDGWRFVSIKTGDLKDPFFVRKTDKRWENLGANTYAGAIAAEKFASGEVAHEHGLTVKEYEDATNRDSVSPTATPN